MLGRVEPRVWTPPLRDLDDPSASWGYDFIDFCALLGWPLDPWEQWLAVHLGELLDDGSPRFRKAIVLVGRQNGKTVFTRLLILYWMWVDRAPEILATSTDRAAAKRSWLKTIKMAEDSPILSADLARRHTALQIGEEDFWNELGSHYRFAAPTRRAGRGDTLPRAILDELREHQTRDVWDAVIPAMSAVSDALVVCISNEGDSASIVLHEEYDAAVAYLETGEGDARTFLAAWSSPPGADPTDLAALAYSNPNLGYRIQADALLGEALKAVRIGGDTLARFRIERMCQRIERLDRAVDAAAWRRGFVPGDLSEVRSRVALCFDVSPDQLHASLYAAAVLDDGKVRVDFVREWSGPGCANQLRRDLPGEVAKVKPQALGWLPAGPAASLTAGMTKRAGWPPPGVAIEAITGDLPAVAMGFAELVSAGKVAHSGDPLLDAHVTAAERLARGDRWVFSRKGGGHIDAAYAAAGAAHIAQTLPPPVGAVRLVT